MSKTLLTNWARPKRMIGAWHIDIGENEAWAQTLKINLSTTGRIH